MHFLFETLINYITQLHSGDSPDGNNCLQLPCIQIVTAENTLQWRRIRVKKIM